jgi:hypothetical protein
MSGGMREEFDQEFNCTVHATEVYTKTKAKPELS